MPPIIPAAMNTSGISATSTGRGRRRSTKSISTTTIPAAQVDWLNPRRIIGTVTA